MQHTIVAEAVDQLKAWSHDPENEAASDVFGAAAKWLVKEGGTEPLDEYDGMPWVEREFLEECFGGLVCWEETRPLNKTIEVRITATRLHHCVYDTAMLLKLHRHS